MKTILSAVSNLLVISRLKYVSRCHVTLLPTSDRFTMRLKYLQTPAYAKRYLLTPAPGVSCSASVHHIAASSVGRTTYSYLS